jgi:hypothetical protein
MSVPNVITTKTAKHATKEFAPSIKEIALEGIDLEKEADVKTYF